MINCHTDRVNAGLCEVFVELAKRFGLKTVAEGIEVVHESHKLQALGCDVGQGYLYAKPMAKAAAHGCNAPPPGRRGPAGADAEAAARRPDPAVRRRLSRIRSACRHGSIPHL